MEVGDTYVFIGKDVEDEHFKNFEYGKSYTISSISFLPDSDVWGSYKALLFHDTLHGCLDIHFDKYFINKQELRDITITKLNI